MKKNINIFILTLFMLPAMGAFAQTYGNSVQPSDDYKKLLRTFFEVNGGIDTQKEAQHSIYVSITKFAFPNMNALQAEEVAQRYLQTHFIVDLVENNAPYYIKYVSEDDLNALVGMYSTQKAQDAVTHVAHVSTSIMTGITTAFKDYIISDGKSRVKRMNYPDSYMQAYKNYYDSGEFKSAFMMIKNAFLNQIGNTHPESITIVERFFEEEFITVLANSCYPTLTEQDLIVLTEIASSKEQHHVTQAMQGMNDDSDNVSNQLMMRYETWLNENY